MQISWRRRLAQEILPPQVQVLSYILPASFLADDLHHGRTQGFWSFYRLPVSRTWTGRAIEVHLNGASGLVGGLLGCKWMEKAASRAELHLSP